MQSSYSNATKAFNMYSSLTKMSSKVAYFLKPVLLYNNEKSEGNNNQ